MDLSLFKFFLDLNGGNINLKNINNQSLLCFTASIGNNYEILNEILGNQKFDPVKSDIQISFINSADIESKKILVEYDKGRLLSFDKIYLLFRLYRNRTNYEKFQSSCEFILRKMNLLPTIPSICTSLLSKKHNLCQNFYRCETCEKSSICEICAKVCHKDHIIEPEYGMDNKCNCNCDNTCQCMSIEQSVHDELYDSIKFTEDKSSDDSGFYDDEEEFEEDGQEENEEMKSLRCTLDLSEFNSMSQPMYHCHECHANICQACALMCHKNHPLKFKGIKSDFSCQCLNITDCKCTSRKDVICTYAFYGDIFVYQPWNHCFDCHCNDKRGCCTTCLKKCHKNHSINSDGCCEAYCNCGADDYHVLCSALNFPPFNYLSSCTNRKQNYEIMKQRMFHCKTCGITAQNQGICEACALQCHLGHNVIYIGVREFVCECLTMNPLCRAPLCPEISSDGICSRLKQGKDKHFPAFVCLSCDKEGVKRFCKSCALKCHKGHDVHFIEYSIFDCQCNPCQCTKNKP